MSRTLLPGLLVALVLACSAEEFREDVILCTDAVRHLLECCGEVLSRGDLCEYHQYEGCDGISRSVRPAIGPPTANCIRNRSCEELRANGTCASVANAEPFVHETDVGGMVLVGSSTPGQPVVCR